MAIEHSAIVDNNIHEPKGVSTATTEQVYVADGASSGSWSNIYTQGFEDYNDATTTGAPISLAVANTWYDMTNDGAGVFTNTTYRLPGYGAIWNTVTNQFEFNTAGLVVGDTVDIRFDFTVTTSASNDTIKFGMDLGHADPSEYRLELVSRTFKGAGTYQVVFNAHIYMGDVLTLNNPAKVVVLSDTTGDSVVVNGWYVRVIPRQPVFA